MGVDTKVRLKRKSSARSNFILFQRNKTKGEDFMYAADKCKHFMEFPADMNRPALCGAYSEARMPNKRTWMHFPVCNEGNCPLKHPELLNGGTLPELTD